MRPTRFNLIVAFICIYFIWGSTYVAIRYAIDSIPPFLMAGVRFIISGFILYGLMRFIFKGPRPNFSNWKASGIIGVLLLVGGNGGVVWAEQTVPVGIASIIIATGPFWMVACDLFLHKVKINFSVFAGIFLGFVGIWFLINPGHMTFDSKGILVLLIAAFLWALGSVWSRSLKQTDSAFLNVGMQMIVGGSVLLLIAFFTGEWNSFNLHSVTRESFLALIYLIIFGSFVGFTAYIWLLKVSTVARVSTYAYVNPVVAVLLGHFLLKETITVSTMVAGAVILLSVMLVQSSQRA